MPYYDDLGRYINPFYLDVHPDVRAELEMRAALVASDFRSANTKSIEWPYQKMPWAHIVSVDDPEIRLGFEKEKFDDKNSDEYGNLLLYDKDRNYPKIPLLTGVEVSNVGQRGSLLKGKFSFTYFPHLTIDGFDLERLQGALFTPGKEVQITFGWSVYAENPWVNKLEFKGLIYGFNWSVQPNLSIVADVEIVSATTIALGLSGDQSVLESEQTDIVKVEGWDTEIKGLNLLTVIDKDMSVITESCESGKVAYVAKENTTEKLLDYWGIGIPTTEYEEIQNIVINNYDYDSTDWQGGGTIYGADGQPIPGQAGQPGTDLVDQIKKMGENFFDEAWNWFGLNYWTDKDSEWNQTKTWQEKWEILKKFSGNPWIRTSLNAASLGLYPATKVPLAVAGITDTGNDEYFEYDKINFGALKYDDTNKSRTINLDFKSIANSYDLQIIDKIEITGIDADAFTTGSVVNNTKRKVEPFGPDPVSGAIDIRIKPNAANIPAKDGVDAKFDRIPITYNPSKHGKQYATLKITVNKYRKYPDRKNTYIQNQPYESTLTRVITLEGEGLLFIATDENGKRAAIDFNVDYPNKDGSPKILKKDKTETFESWEWYGLDNENNEYVQFGNVEIFPDSANAKNDKNALKILQKMSTADSRYSGPKKEKISKKQFSFNGKNIGNCVQHAHYMKFEFTPKLEGSYKWLVRIKGHRWVCGTNTQVNQNPYEIQVNLLADVGPVNPRTPQDASIAKEYKDKDSGNAFNQAKSEIQAVIQQRELELASTTGEAPATENPTDTQTTTDEQPVSATNESDVKVTVTPKTYWYTSLGSLVEFANSLLERFETDKNNKSAKKMLFKIQAFNNEAEYNPNIVSAYPIDVFFPDERMGRYGDDFCPFDKPGLLKDDGNQVLRTFIRGRDSNGKYNYVLEEDVINLGYILVGIDAVKRTYESFLVEGGKNIALKNITKFFDEIIKMISTASGEIYQLTTILFEEPEKLIPRSEYISANENQRLRGGSRVEMSDIFNYNATRKRSKSLVSIEDTNLAAKVIKEGSVEPYKFDATMIRPMLRNVSVISKPSKEAAAAAYIAARGYGSIKEGGTGTGLQNLEVTLNLRGFQNMDEYKKELQKTKDDMAKDLSTFKKSGWDPSWSEKVRGNLIKLKRLTVEPDANTGLGTSWLNRAMYPIEFNLTLDGINGFKFGDVIKTSLIPKHYNVDWGIVFTVIKIVHKVNLTAWETTLYTAARLDATRNYASEVMTPYQRPRE